MTHECYNLSMFLETLEQAAIEKCGLNRDQKILVGVSGGADSLALLIGLETLGFNLSVAHLDHALRPDSARDGDFVEQLADTYGLPFVRRKIDVAKSAEIHGQSLEEAARYVRYRFLFDSARSRQAQAVAVAHHADDQVETVLMHFLRGSALPGLSGMDYRTVLPLWDASIPLVRPLLGIWRLEIDAFVAERGLVPRIDESNIDTTYFRNRLRHELIPELSTYNPQIRDAILRMSQVLREEDRYLQELAEEAWEECSIIFEEGSVIVSRAPFCHLPKALQRRVFRRAVSLLRPDLRDVDFAAIERGLDFLAAPSESGETDLVARLNLVLLDDVFILKTWRAALPDWGKPLLNTAADEKMLDVDHPVGLRHGWRLQAELIEDIPEKFTARMQSLDDYETWLDYDRLEMPLTVRGREAGDRWQPLGMEDHTQKLQDFLINEKIDAHLRDVWPLVCSNEEIAWVVGLRPSEKFKVTVDTRRILSIRTIQDQ